MNNEASVNDPLNDQDIEKILETPNQDLRLNVQAHVNNKPGPKIKQDTTITIEGLGKVVGRDKKPILSADVFKLAAIGMKDIEIAEWHGIDDNTLRYNFSVSLLKGRLTLSQSLRRKQIEVAMSGNPTMLIWLGKNILGQTDSPLSSGESVVLPWDDK